MALIACPECAREISDRAGACPHCGCPVGDPGVKAATTQGGKVEVQVSLAPQEKPGIFARTGRAIFGTIAVVVALAFGIFLGLNYLNQVNEGQSDDSTSQQGDDQVQPRRTYVRQAHQVRRNIERWRRRIVRAVPRLRLARKQTLADSKPHDIGKNQKLSLSYKLKRRATLHIKVVERFGKRIEFNVLQDGTRVYRSGVQRGSASSSLVVQPGLVSIVIHNGNWMRSKHVFVTVKATW